MQNRETEEKTLNIYIFPSVQMIIICHFLRNNDSNNFTYLILIIYLIFSLSHNFKQILSNDFRDHQIIIEVIQKMKKTFVYDNSSYTFSNLKTFNQFNFKI